MMKIISHRGFWKKSDEKNKIISFERSFENGFGTETDIRDYKGELVISHDIPDENSLSLNDFFKLYNNYKNPELVLALNIKSDGLQKKLKEKLVEYEITNYFVFDMSIPDTLGYLSNSITAFSRQSEYELTPFLDSRIEGIWLDSFNDIWYDKKIIKNHVANSKRVVIVSSELHKRNHIELWQFIKNNNIHLINDVTLCTDLPEAASEFFKN